MGNSRFPLLTNYGGHLLSPLRVVAIVAANDNLRDSLFAFANALPRSQWWPEVATPFGISANATAFTVTGPPLAAGTQLTSGDLGNYVQHSAVDSAGYTPNGHTVYLLFLPPGVTFCPTCFQFPVFHSPFGPSDALALVSHPPANVTSAVTTMTIGASHEIVEAATDPELNGWKLVAQRPPWTGSPWAFDGDGTVEEAADMCADTRYIESGFSYSRIFSDQAAALGGDPCVPAIAAPYYNVTTSQAWYATSTGDVTVPITGWSTGAAAEWELEVSSGTHTSSLAAPTYNFLSCPDTATFGTVRICALTDGGTGMLHVVLPPGSGSGSYFTVRVSSERLSATGLVVGPNDDYAHHWMFGVYVP